MTSIYSEPTSGERTESADDQEASIDMDSNEMTGDAPMTEPERLIYQYLLGSAGQRRIAIRHSHSG